MSKTHFKANVIELILCFHHDYITHEKTQNRCGDNTALGEVVTHRDTIPLQRLVLPLAHFYNSMTVEKTKARLVYLVRLLCFSSFSLVDNLCGEYLTLSGPANLPLRPTRCGPHLPADVTNPESITRTCRYSMEVICRPISSRRSPRWPTWT